MISIYKSAVKSCFSLKKPRNQLARKWTVKGSTLQSENVLIKRKKFQRKQMSQDRNIYISTIFTLEFLFWLCGVNIIFQMHIGLQNSKEPRNTCFYKVKKTHSGLILNRTAENKTNTIDKQILAKSHWNNPNSFHSREKSKSAVCKWMLFLNTRNKQKPQHRKVQMLNPSISASMGFSSISRAKGGRHGHPDAHSRW